MPAAETGLQEGVSFDPARLRWSRLEYRASKLLIRATSSVEIGLDDAAAARVEWPVPVQGIPSVPRGSRVVHLELASRLLRRSSRLDLWLDPASGAALQRSQLETGSKLRHNRLRSLRFTDSGISLSTRRATDETIDGPVERWPLSQVFKPYPEKLPPGAVVSEPSGLFYFLAVSALESPGDEVTTHLFSQGRVVSVSLAVEERIEVGVDYLASGSAASGQRRVEGRMQVLRVRLGGRPLMESDERADFRLLGLGGDIEIFLDPENRLPIRISGEIPGAGRGRVRLRRVVLTPAR